MYIYAAQVQTIHCAFYFNDKNNQAKLIRWTPPKMQPTGIGEGTIVSATSAGGVPIRDTSSSSSSSSSSLCGPDEREEEEEEEEPSSDQGTGVTGSALGGQKHINSRETWQNFWDLGLGFGIWIRDLGFGDMAFGTVELSMGYTILELTRAH
jgi:hypothetical protein